MQQATAQTELQYNEPQAPRPLRSSLQRSLYDAIEELDKPSTSRQIRRELGKTEDSHRWRRNDIEYIEQQLARGVRDGYLRREGPRWGIATRTQYEARTRRQLPDLQVIDEACDSDVGRQIADNLLAASKPGQTANAPGAVWADLYAGPPKPRNRFLVAHCLLAGFCLGLGVALLIVGV